VPAAVLEAAEIRVAHEADVAELGALDDDHVVFIEVLALVYEFHGCLRGQGNLENPKRYHDAQGHCSRQRLNRGLDA
jgi:hypothetical protein